MSRLPDEDDDPAKDWSEGDPTALDRTVVATTDPITAPHDLTAIAHEAEIEKARDDACRTCFTEGQEDALGALRSVLLARGLENEPTAHLVLAVRQQLTKL